jgi:diguanylate cyclase (GGDEF)-like protein/PAS domain S-box-containing protein
MPHRSHRLAGLSGVTLADMFAHLPQPVVVADLERTIAYVNRAAVELFGYAAETMVGKPTAFLYEDAAAARAQGRVRYHADAEPGATSYRMSYRRADGTTFLAETVGGPVRSESGETVAFVGFLRVATGAERSLHVLQRMQEVCSETSSVDERIGKLLALGSKHLGLPLAIQSRIQGADYEVERCEVPPGGPVPGTHFDVAGTYCSFALKERGAVGFHYMGSLPERHHPCYQSFRLEAYLGCRVEVDGVLYGTINFSSPQPCEPFSPDDMSFVALLARWVGTALSEDRLARQLEQLTRKDPLTGLLNRRGLFDDVAWLVAHVARTGEALSVVSLDLDRFKQINDRFGHAAGDRVLQATADVVRAVGRESDRCGRLGGEELLLVLPDTEAEGAARAAERVRQALRSLALPALQGGSVTASFGVATLCPGEGFASLLERADEALYAAKRQGRDQVCVSASPCEQISARTAT